MKKVLITLILTGICLLNAGCESDAGTGALIGSAIGAGVGQAAGGDTESTLIGAAVGGGTGYVVGSQSDKNKTDQSQTDSQQEKLTIWITNSNGSQTPVTLKRQGDKYIGPKGETYKSRPTEEQLRKVYGF